MVISPPPSRERRYPAADRKNIAAGFFLVFTNSKLEKHIHKYFFLITSCFPLQVNRNLPVGKKRRAGKPELVLFPSLIWIFTHGEGGVDRWQFRLTFNRPYCVVGGKRGRGGEKGGLIYWGQMVERGEEKKDNLLPPGLLFLPRLIAFFAGKCGFTLNAMSTYAALQESELFCLPSIQTKWHKIMTKLQ